MKGWRVTSALAAAAVVTLGLARAAPSSEPRSGAPSASASAKPAPEAPSFPVEEVRLANGLRVVLAPDATLPTVTIQVRYDVGRSDDPDGLQGLAHLVEHLTYSGSRHVPRGGFLRLAANAGATNLNGTTSLDSTTYHATLPPERLELALWLESDRMGFFLDAVDEAALAQERAVVLTERRTRFVDQPEGLAQRMLFPATFPAWHPYHAEPAGEPSAIEKITLADVRAFFGTWYGPENATLTLGGHFDATSAMQLVRRYFEGLPRHPPPVRPSLPPIPAHTTTRLQIGASILQEEVFLSWVTPKHGEREDAALDWIATILCDREKARLRVSLIGGGRAKRVACAQASFARASVFVVQAIGVIGHPAEELRDAIDREIAKLAATGPTADELARVDADWSVHDLFRLETSFERVSRLAGAADLGPITTSFRWIDRRRDFSSSELRDVVTRQLSIAARAAEILSRARPSAPISGALE